MSVPLPAALLVLAALAAGAAFAQTAEKLRAVEREVRQGQSQADRLAGEAASLDRQAIAIRTETVARARAAQDLETRISHLEEALAEMEASEAEIMGRLAAERASLARTLAGLQRIALQPPEAVMIEPAAPVTIVRSAILLGVAVPAIEARVGSIRQELDQLRLLREDILVQRDELRRAGEALAAEQARLEALMAEKAALARSAEAEQRATLARVSALAAQARDLRELLARLAAPPAPKLAIVPPPAPERPPADAPAAEPVVVRPGPDRPADLRPFPAARASLTQPARGRLVGRFGEAAAGDGVYGKGITIEARPGAQVVAPYDGQVVFRGPFRGYGEILIIEHAGGYHTLLAGLGRCDVAVGQWLLAGEPVGTMGPATGGSPRLYVELRRGGQPIDPLPWLAVHDDKLE